MKWGKNLIILNLVKKKKYFKVKWNLSEIELIGKAYVGRYKKLERKEKWK